MKFPFWDINNGLFLLVMISVFQVCFMQTEASVAHGRWYDRSAEFMQRPLLQTFRWLCVIGDVIFAIGVLAFAVFESVRKQDSW